MPSLESQPLATFRAPELFDVSPYARVRVPSVSEVAHNYEPAPELETADPREAALSASALKFSLYEHPELFSYGPMH